MSMNTRNAIALTLATPALGLTLALGLELSPAVHAHHDAAISAQQGINAAAFDRGAYIEGWS